MEKKVESALVYFKTRLESIDGEALYDWLLANTNFSKQPASTKYHMCYEGGLIVYLTSVYDLMCELNKTLQLNIPNASLIKVGLLHEIGKFDMYEQYAMNKKIYDPDGSKSDELGKFYWQSVMAYKVSDNYYPMGSVGMKSYLYAAPFIQFTPEEIVAITNYNFINDRAMAVDINEMMKNNKLLTLLHLARTAVMYLDEDTDDE